MPIHRADPYLIIITSLGVRHLLSHFYIRRNLRQVLFLLKILCAEF